MTPHYWPQATHALATADAVLEKLIEQFEGMAIGSRGDAFSTLARAIVGQQLSVKAAQSVWERLRVELVPMMPGTLLKAQTARLRACGLSGQKVVYLRDLAERFESKALDVSAWNALDDEAVIEQLTQVKGIGRWTAEMFLIFYMARPDVFPLDDVGLQRALRTCYTRGRPVSLARMRKIGAGWAPWRSVATWYLWRSLDPLPLQY